MGSIKRELRDQVFVFKTGIFEACLLSSRAGRLGRGNVQERRNYRAQMEGPAVATGGDASFSLEGKQLRC